MLNWKKFNNIEVFKVLRIKRGAVITVDRADGTLANLDLAELAAINSIASASSAGLAITGAISATTIQVTDVIDFVNADQRTQIGFEAGKYDLGQFNTWVGYQAGSASSATGKTSAADNNNGIGYQSLFFNETGASNNALGVNALYNNKGGSNNNGIGHNALVSNVNGSNNNAMGSGAGRYLTDGTTVNAAPANSVFLGHGTKALADSQTNQIVIGFDATGIGSNSVVLGNDSILFTALKGSVGIGKTNPATQLEISTDGATKPSTNTWTIASDERLKTDITLADLDRCYEIVKYLPLKRYTWKDSSYTLGDVKDRAKLGWIAQDVQQVFPKSTPTRKFDFVPEDDGFENVKEQVTIDEARTTESTSIEIIDGIPTRKMTSTTETVTVPQFDEVAVVDEMGRPVIVDGAPMMHAVPRMRTVSRPKTKTVTIDDCLSLNSDQIYAAMYGAIQMLIAKVEALEAR